MRTATANPFELELGDFLPVAVAGLNALTRQPMRGERAERKNYNNPSTIRSIGLSRSKGFEPKEGFSLSATQNNQRREESFRGHSHPSAEISYRTGPKEFRKERRMIR
jgi:hypothetical protein